MNIAFVGLSGVPYSKRACDVRLMAFAKALTETQNQVFVFNRLPTTKVNEQENIKINSSINIIENFSNNKITNTFLLKLLVFPIELIKILFWHRKIKLDLLHVYTGHYIDMLFYKLLSLITRSKVIYQYVEFRSAIPRKGLYHRINGYLCDYYGYKMFDGLIVISNFLEKHISSQFNGPIIKIPPLCDFDLFDSVSIESNHQKYVLYCGSVDYIDVINQIIGAYELSDCSTNGIKLCMILNGKKDSYEGIVSRTKFNTNINIFSNIDYKLLIRKYKEALALLIPIRNNLQDIARFPNKIGEYTASRSVIITTNYGEVPYYFKNGENALISQENNVQNLTKKLNELFSRNNLEDIKNNSYLLGKEKFNIVEYEFKLNTFIYNVVKERK